MESIGKELQKEREARGISLKDISLQTKIGLRYLEAIEEDQLDFLPGGFFTRQILKAYISAIGLNPAEYLPRYEESGLIPGEVPATPSHVKLEKKKKEIRIDRIIWISLTIIVLALFVFLIYLSITGSRKNIEARKSVQAVRAEVVIPAEEQLAQTESEVITPEPLPQAVPGLNLELNFNEDCWVQVYADGNLIVDGLKLEGFKIQVRAESELILNLGNAGGISYSLNGQPGKPLGKRGAVVKNIRITRDNLDQFLAQEEKPE
jgi:transcriptional regulator with XRE-family HTH domain